MSHLDEGTLHALLDGELDGAETRQIEAHLGRCTACGTRFDEVKNVRAEADRLIGSLGQLDSPATATATAIATRLTEPLESWDGSVILIPEPLDSELQQERRRRMMKRAATILVVVGAGFFAMQSRFSRAPAPEPVIPQSVPATGIATDSAVLGPEESVAPAVAASPAPVSDSASALARTRLDERVTTSATPPRPESAAAAVDSDGDLAAKKPTRKDAAHDVRAAGGNTAAAEAAAELARLRTARPVDQQAAMPDDESLKRMRAAAATADIDRQKQVVQQQQAEPADREALVPAPAQPQAAPSSIEDRSQIYLRIDRAEAKRQLGTPVHALEGMTPVLIGLIQGRLSPGMDTSRPVVRAVYLDAMNRLVFLDQQRLRPGQSIGAETPLRSAIDDVVVQLRGESSVSVNVLRNLAGQVR